MFSTSILALTSFKSLDYLRKTLLHSCSSPHTHPLTSDSKMIPRKGQWIEGCSMGLLMAAPGLAVGDTKSAMEASDKQSTTATAQLKVSTH
ncbi:hypothetical protein Vadar_014630 [Vaccinium darrowii]|uniref:Uncharacterized protein n=1 Tax=Vaccinium darrowii TaxID=229202 RepID=A0ACB7YEV6_9ERIC|nr:hypothetical protein Vadar_014630 [Vaccinium darrowii]